MIKLFTMTVDLNNIAVSQNTEGQHVLLFCFPSFLTDAYSSIHRYMLFQATLVEVKVKKARELLSQNKNIRNCFLLAALGALGVKLFWTLVVLHVLRWNCAR